LYTLAVWHLLRKFSREPARSVVTDTLVVGRRLLGDELDGDFDNYVDLTAEFAEPAAVRTAAAYRSFPILDGAAPSAPALRAAVDNLQPGRTYIHCAQGHGRTGLFALAVLLKSNSEMSVDDGLQMLQAARPGIRLNRAQLRCIRQFAADGNPNPPHRPVHGWVPSTPEVCDATINDIERLHPAIAIHFWAPWNGTDPPMDRAIQSISAKFGSRLAFFSCNVDRAENIGLCRRYGIANLPALVLIVAGQPQKPIVGLSSPEQLAEKIESRLRTS
jgi:hypothetical protein